MTLTSIAIAMLAVAALLGILALVLHLFGSRTSWPKNGGGAPPSGSHTWDEDER